MTTHGAFAWSERAVREALGLPAGSGNATYTGISTDTRTISSGSLFVALAGERFDAHDFLDSAAKAGAAAAVVRLNTPPVPGLPLIEVPDTLQAYGMLARARRRQIAGPVVAITGTNGKTSTKEMVAAVLRTRWRTHATRANLNNLVGVPQTILEAAARYRGAGHRGGSQPAGRNCALPGDHRAQGFRSSPTPPPATWRDSAPSRAWSPKSWSWCAMSRSAFVGTNPPTIADRSRALGAGKRRDHRAQPGGHRCPQSVIGGR